MIAYDEDLPPVELVLDAVDVHDLAAANPAAALPAAVPGLRHRPRGTGRASSTPGPRERHDWTLIGCERSRAVPPALLRRRAAAGGPVPAQARRGGRAGARTAARRSVLTKCCLIERGLQVDGDTAVVPWGTTLDEVRDGAARAAAAARPRGDPASARRRLPRPRCGDRERPRCRPTRVVYRPPVVDPGAARALRRRGPHPGAGSTSSPRWPRPRPTLGLVPARGGGRDPRPCRCRAARPRAGRRETRATGHSTLGLIRGAARARCPRTPREWVYYGATVQDVTDTWFALVFRDGRSTSSSATSAGAGTRPRPGPPSTATP